MRRDTELHTTIPVNNFLINRSALRVVALLMAAWLSACGGGGSGSATTTDDSSTTTQTSSSGVASCTPVAQGTSGYGLVFKACNGSVAEYYDRTECVKDLATGLIWEGKPAVGPRAASLTYTNYDDVNQPQFMVSRSPVSYRNPSFAEINAPSNSVGYQNSVNASGLCGFSDWRMPRREELLGLVNPYEYPAIDNLWFPNTNEWYWSGTAVPGYPQYVGIVYFSTAYTSNFTHDIDRVNLAYVRLVRNAP